VTRAHRDEIDADGEQAARDRFEGEYPAENWPRGRAAEALQTGYAPSKHRTKQWPLEARLEVWCSLSREARECFVLDALTAQADELIAMTCSTGWLRVATSTSTAVLNANQPPGVNGDDVRDRDGCALDTAFPGKLLSSRQLLAAQEDPYPVGGPS